MTADTPIAVDAPMALADDVSAAPQTETTPTTKRTDVGGGGVAAEVDEQQLKRSREIWEHVKEEQYEGTDALPLPLSTRTLMLTLTLTVAPVIEQLPLTLQRYLTLMRELDIQAQGLCLFPPSFPPAAAYSPVPVSVSVSALPSPPRRNTDRSSPILRPSPQTRKS